ncbi:unnamed protein product [Prorocentrum cordatum]|uniref:WW domain-containing protein n=1 Tax=Prorocentrum cordatum TaxID=2364126 RepID=A0ABN9RPB8_9DINO|nr:unnamed protein product [Polarella glacialis]
MATDDGDLTLEGNAAMIRALVEKKNLQFDVSHALAEAQAMRERYAQKPQLPVAPVPAVKALMAVLRQPDGQLLSWIGSGTGARQRWPSHLLAVRYLMTYVLQRRVASYRAGSQGSQISIPALAQALAMERAGGRPPRDPATTPPAAAPSATLDSQAVPHAGSASSLTPAAALGLPPGWAAAVDPISGYTYYFNQGMGTTQWGWPEARVAMNEPAPRSRSPPQNRPSRWGASGTATPGPAPAEPAESAGQDAVYINYNAIADLAIQIHAAPPASIDTLANELLTLCGSQVARMAALKSAAGQLAARGLSTAASATHGLTFLLSVGQTATPDLGKFAALGGNMYAYYLGNASSFGLFLAAHPEAVAALPSWRQASPAASQSAAPATPLGHQPVGTGASMAPAPSTSGAFWARSSQPCGAPAPDRAGLSSQGLQRQPRQPRGQTRRVEGWRESDFADLRAKHPPSDPEMLAQAWAPLAQGQDASQGMTILKFVPLVGPDRRESKWLWWMALARVGFYVRELYGFTNFAGSANSSAGVGTPGQEVVRTPLGTVIGMCRDKRIYTPSGGPGLTARLALRFPIYNPVVDMAGFHCGRMPKQVAEALLHTA